MLNRRSVHTALTISGDLGEKMIDRGRVGKRRLIRSQINSKNARVSQTIDRMEEVAVKAVSTVFTCSHSH